MDRRLTRALVALPMSLALTGALLAAPGPRAAARDLETLRAEAQVVADRVSRLEKRLGTLEEEAAALTERIEAATAELAGYDLEAQEARDELNAVTDVYVERAVAAYKAGPYSQVAMLLSARSLNELYTVAEINSRAAGLDSDLIEDLHGAEAAARAAIERVDDRKQTLIRARARAEEIGGSIRATLSERSAELDDLTVQITKLEEKARAAAAQAAANSGINVGQALLDLLAPSGPSNGIPDGFAPTGVRLEGIASWYGPGFEGNLTASGDVFDSSLYTVASKELPLGTWLYVEHEGRGVVVLVNDRGPYVGDRILDLSKAAAFAIGITGLGWVEAEVLIKL